MTCPVGRPSFHVFGRGATRERLERKGIEVKYMILTFGSQAGYQEMAGQSSTSRRGRRMTPWQAASGVREDFSRRRHDQRADADFKVAAT